MYRRFNVVTFGLVSLLSASCFPTPIVVATDSGSDSAIVNDSPDTNGSRTYEFAMLFLAARRGLNLDGLVSTPTDLAGCSVMDDMGTTVGRYTIPDGIDNQFPALETALSTIPLPPVRAALYDQGNRSKITLAMRVSGVDDLVNDPSVQVEVMTVLPTFGGSCSSMMRGRTYAEWSRGQDRPTKITASGMIMNGVFSFSAPRSQLLYVPVLLNGQLLELPLRGLSAMSDVGTAEDWGNGTLGARVNSFELYRSLIDTRSGTVGVAQNDAQRALSGAVVDLQVANQYCSFNSNATADTSGDIGIAFGFDMSRSIVQSTPLSAPMQGTCYFE